MNRSLDCRLPLSALLLGALLAAPAGADATLCTLRVHNPGPERTAVPIRVRLAVPPDQASATTCLLIDADGSRRLGQLTPPGLLSEPGEASAEGGIPRDLHVVVANLPSGADFTWKVVLQEENQEASPEAFGWHAEPGQWAELRLGDRPVLRYMHAPYDDSSPARRDATYKVYHHLYNPQGTRLVTKGLGGLYPHHRGLFYGYNRIRYDGHQADIWHCRNGEHQSHRKLLEAVAGPVVGRHRVAIDWYGRDNDLFATEEREMSVYNVDGGILVEFASRLTTTGPTVQLDGDPQHAGFHFRASQDVPDKTRDQTYYLRPDGRGRPGQFRNWPDNPDHINLPWNALSFVLDGLRYTCCYLDHPDNPKPARYSERDYGRFGSYFPYTLDAEHPLEAHYRIWLQEGEMEGEQVGNHWRNFVEPPPVDVVDVSSPDSASPVEK